MTWCGLTQISQGHASQEHFLPKYVYTVCTEQKSDLVACLVFDQYTICNDNKTIHYVKTNFVIQ